MLSGKLISTWSVQCQSSQKTSWYTRWIKWSNGVSEQFSSESTTPWHTARSRIIISLNSSRKWTGDTWPNGSWICISSHLGTALACSITLVCMINLKIPFPCFCLTLSPFLVVPISCDRSGKCRKSLSLRMPLFTCRSGGRYHMLFNDRDTASQRLLSVSMSNPTRKYHVV